MIWLCRDCPWRNEPDGELIACPIFRSSIAADNMACRQASDLLDAQEQLQGLHLQNAALKSRLGI
jgi:hypothetical protein